MNTTKEQQKELDDALVAPENRPQDREKQSPTELKSQIQGTYYSTVKPNAPLQFPPVPNTPRGVFLSKSNTPLRVSVNPNAPLWQICQAKRSLEQQKELDDALVAPENHLKIGKYNLRLSSNIKYKEPTLQVVLEALKLTPFYNAFEISANVPKIYMQEFWVTVTRHHSSLRFNLDGKSHTVNRSFAAIINKCLSGKTNALESLRLSRAQILWGMYHNKQVDYVYLLWEDLVFQVENKNSKKNNDMYYPRFTKVIVDYFMAKDQAIPRRNKMFWHYARDDFMFTTIRVISKHKDTQEYGAILPQHLTNQAMLESEAFKTYRAYATGEKAPKSKATKKKTDSESSPKTKPSQASKGKRIKTSAKGDKPSTTKSKGLTVLSEVALSEAEQMKLATKRSLTEFHVSHASGSGDGVDLQSKVPDEQQQTRSGTNEGAGDKPEHDSDDDNDDNDDNDDEEDDQENDSQRTESDNEGDDFVHPNLSTYKPDDEEEEKEEEKAEDDDEVISDQKVSTPPDYELTEEDVNQEDDDTMGEDQEDEENGELYGDLNINLDRQDAKMTDAQTNQETEEAHVTLTTEPLVGKPQSSSVSSDLVAKFINPPPDTGIDSILNPNVAVSVTPSSDTIIPQPPIPIIQPQQQTHDSTTTTTIPTTLPEILNFASLFGFERRVSSLEIELSELKQTNQYAEVVASILGIINHQSLTSYAVASSLSELELKNILMDKMEENKSIEISEVQKNLYRALLEAYNSDKDLLSSYGEVMILKRGRDDQDKDEEPSVGSKRGSKRQRSGKEESLKESTQKKSKSTGSSKGTTISPPKSSGKSVQEEEHDPRVDWRISCKRGTTSSFNEFLATPIDFSAFMMNQLNIQFLTPDLLTGPTYDLIKGMCKSVVELENTGKPTIFNSDVTRSSNHLYESLQSTMNLEILKWRGGGGGEAQVVNIQLQSPRQRRLITVILNGLKTRFLEVHGVRYKLSMTSIATRHIFTGTQNVRDDMIFYQPGNSKDAIPNTGYAVTSPSRS
ncbi:hypothetical protein Tco_1236615 [Tanacetum coccineum]